MPPHPEQATAPRPEQVAAERIRALRTRHGWTQQQLADRLREFGSPIDRVAIAKLETGQRRLPLDEALLFAYALDVAPTSLFIPFEDEYVQIAPTRIVKPTEARLWVTGQQALPEQDIRFYFAEVPEADFAARLQALYEHEESERVTTEKLVAARRKELEKDEGGD